MNKNIKLLVEDYLQSFNPAVLDNGTPKNKISQDIAKDAVSDRPKTKLELRQLIEERIKEIKDRSYGATLDLSYINTSAITDMSELFKGIFTKKRSFIIKIDFSGWDTSNVTDMSQMFFGCKDLRFLDLSQFDTKKVTNMSKMFYNCTKLWEIDVSSFDTSNVDNMSRMFQNCTDLESLDVTNFYIKKNADLKYMFYKCSGLHKKNFVILDHYLYIT